jgi:hypothetical protein
MAKIWRNRLLASLNGDSDRTFDEVPQKWKADVKKLLLEDVAAGIITPEQYEQIVGEAYVAEE